MEQLYKYYVLTLFKKKHTRKENYEKFMVQLRY